MSPLRQIISLSERIASLPEDEDLYAEKMALGLVAMDLSLQQTTGWVRQLGGEGNTDTPTQGPELASRFVFRLEREVFEGDAVPSEHANLRRIANTLLHLADAFEQDPSWLILSSNMPGAASTKLVVGDIREKVTNIWKMVILGQVSFDEAAAAVRETVRGIAGIISQLKRGNFDKVLDLMVFGDVDE